MEASYRIPCGSKDGAFHTICNLLAIIGKRFSDAGLRDLAVESGIVAEGSINGVLEGKKYNRSLRMHKIIYEALLRTAWKSFQSWLLEHHAENIHQLEDLLKIIEDLHDETSQDMLQTMLEDASCEEQAVILAKQRQASAQIVDQAASKRVRAPVSKNTG